MKKPVEHEGVYAVAMVKVEQARNVYEIFEASTIGTVTWTVEGEVALEELIWWKLRFECEATDVLLEDVLNRLESARVCHCENWWMIATRGGSRTAATSKMEHFVITANGFQPLTIITKSSILNAATVLDSPLATVSKIIVITFIKWLDN